MTKDYIKQNITEIRANIERAAIKSGRKSSDITLIGVTKTVGVDEIKALLSCGVSELGENRVQALTEKRPLLPDDISWHLIGHLQTNKVKYVVGNVALIHSVDSLKLAEEINRAAMRQNVTADILIEVNIAGEESKHGVEPSVVKSLVKEFMLFDNIKVKGLMTVAPYVDNPEENRKYFRKMTDLFVDINREFNNNIDMSYLSMGMTNDYEVAIEEGANMVRIGTGIFAQKT